MLMLRDNLPISMWLSARSLTALFDRALTGESDQWPSFAVAKATSLWFGMAAEAVSEARLILEEIIDKPHLVPLPLSIDEPEIDVFAGAAALIARLIEVAPGPLYGNGGATHWRDSIDDPSLMACCTRSLPRIVHF